MWTLGQRDMEVVRAVDEAPPSDDTQPATPRTGVGDHLSLHWGTSFGLMGVHGGHIRDPTALLMQTGNATHANARVTASLPFCNYTHVLLGCKARLAKPDGRWITASNVVTNQLRRAVPVL